jgi:AraC-like DNA-binding protein
VSRADPAFGGRKYYQNRRRRWFAVAVSSLQFVPLMALCRLAHLARERTGLCDVVWRACATTGLAALGLLGHLVANSESVAAALGLRRRTSARRLDEHGVSFHELLDEARFLAARNLLQISRVPVTEITARLGYSDTPAFTRAFRRWAETSPTEWRYRYRTI